MHIEHVDVDAFAKDHFALVGECRRVTQVAANLLNVIMILDRHAENNCLLVVRLLSWSGEPNGLLEVQSRAHHRRQLEWPRHHVLLVPATLHVPLLDVLLVEPASSEHIECSQEDAFTLDSLVEMWIDLDLLV